MKSALAAPVRALAAGMLALFLVAACGGGGGSAAGPGTETPNPDPELLAPEDSMRLARALSLRNANGGEQAASVFGVPNASHDPAILDVNPFADSAVALAGRRVAARETAAEYKLGNRNFPVPDDSPLLTLAVWIDPAALTSGNGREFLKIQIFISPANLAAFAGDEPGAQIHVIPVTPPVVQPPQPPDPVVAVTLTATAFHPDSPSVTIGETAGRETITVSVSAPVEIGRANGVATLEVTETLLTRITLVGKCRIHLVRRIKIKPDGSLAGTTPSEDYLEGCDDRGDVFDADEGGNDELYGFSGNDVYRLGRGTDSDIILESVLNSGDPADKILIEADSGGVSVVLRRGENGGDKFSGEHDLVVELLPPEGGEVRDRLIVEDFYYYYVAAQVEFLEFASDGSRHNLIALAGNFAEGDSVALAIPGASAYNCEPELNRGTPKIDYIVGCDDLSDVFDADAGGDDELYGLSGDDVYHLGRGTDSDVIYEGLFSDGDPADKILIEADTGGLSVVLRRGEFSTNLVVELLPPEGGGEVRDRLIVPNFYYYDPAQVEILEFASDGSRHNLIALAGNFAEGDSVALAIPDANAQPPDPVVAVTLTATAFHPDSPSVTIGETAGRETITVSVSAPVEIGRANGVATLEVTETLLTRITLVDNKCLDFDRLKPDGSIAGTTGEDYLEGGCDDQDDVFDSDLGGNDELFGFSGNDVYRLGRGTDSDIVLEGVFNDWGDPADKILIEADSGGVSVILRHGENGGDKFSGKGDLVVELLPPEGGEVRDRLIVEDFYYEDTYRVEILEFASDGSRHNLIWLTRNFAPGDSIALAIPGASAPSVFYDCEPELDRGTPETDYILGCDNVSDVFDADAGGNDELYGFSGDDVYRLGRGTDSDVIYEGLVYDGDPADKILIEADTEGVSVVLRHDGYPNNLVVELLPPEGGGEVRDRLIVQNFYYYDAAQVEFLEFASDGSRHNLIALAGNFAEGDSVALAIPDANALSDTDNEDEEQAAQVRNRFAAAFNPGPAFGDAFGKGGKSGASLESRMRAMARSAGFRDGGEDDGFAVWSAENDFGKVWFSPSQRGDFGFGAAGRGEVLLGTDSFRNPFAALAGNAMAGGGEWDFRGMRGMRGVGGMGGSARFSAFGDFRLSTGLDGDVRRWADWAVRGVGADDLLNKVRPLAALAQDGARVRGAMGEVRFGADDGAGVGFQAGALGEADAVLAGTGDEGDGGEGGEGGLRGLRSRTAFAGLSGRTGEWFGWRFRGAAHWGRTSAESSGLLESGLLWSGSYSAGVERSGMFRVGDAFGFRLSQPLRVESGMFRLRGDGVGTEASAVPTGRQLDAEVLYRVPLRGWGGWSLNAEGWALLSAGWRRHDGHSESSSPQAGALFEAEWAF